MSMEPYQPEPETHEEQMEVLQDMVRVRDSTISAQGARIAELEDFVKRVDMGEYENYINIMFAAKHIMEEMK